MISLSTGRFVVRFPYFQPKKFRENARLVAISIVPVVADKQATV